MLDCLLRRTSDLSWTLLGLSWGRLGPLLGASWSLLGLSWALLGRSWDALGTLLGTLGALLGSSWPSFGPSWASLGEFLALRALSDCSWTRFRSFFEGFLHKFPHGTAWLEQRSSEPTSLRGGLCAAHGMDWIRHVQHGLSSLPRWSSG